MQHELSGIMFQESDMDQIQQDKIGFSSSIQKQKQHLLKILYQQQDIQHNQQIMQKFIYFLQSDVDLFRKIDPIFCKLILSRFRIVYFHKNQVIYRTTQRSLNFYILLIGKVGLINKKDQFKKVCRPGSSLGEQIIIKQSLNLNSIIRWEHGIFPRLQTAKALTECYLLQITPYQYEKLFKQANKKQMKLDFKVLDSLLVRNFNQKNTLRHCRFY